MAINSKSYIIVTCTEDAEFCENYLLLRTDPPTPIHLMPGDNYLTVEEWPELKYGFYVESAHQCADVREIDLSFFDGAEMVSMERMFNGMKLRKLTFGNLCTSNVRSANLAFAKIGFEKPAKDNLAYPQLNEAYEELDVLDISSLDFSQLEVATAMFQGANFNTLVMKNADLRNLKKAIKMFSYFPNKVTLILDGLKNDHPEVIGMDAAPIEVSLKGCSKPVIKALIETIENNIKKHRGSVHGTYILDYGVSYSLSEDSNGKIICTVENVRKTEEEFKAHWIKRASLPKWERNNVLFNAVEDFYIKFLEQAPTRYISYLFDPNGPDGVTGATPRRWESVSSQAFDDLVYLFAGGLKLYVSDEDWSNATNQVVALYRGGNLDFALLEDALNGVSNDKWNKWLGEPLTFNKKLIKLYNIQVSGISRVDAVMLHLCCIPSFKNIPSEVEEELMKYYGFVNK